MRTTVGALLLARPQDEHFADVSSHRQVIGPPPPPLPHLPAQRARNTNSFWNIEQGGENHKVLLANLSVPYTLSMVSYIVHKI